MKCRNCKYNGFKTDEGGEQYSWCEIAVDNLDVDEERDCASYVPATHADQIRAMTDEELVAWCVKYFICPEVRPWCETREHGTIRDCKKCWLKWLREEVEE